MALFQPNVPVVSALPEVQVDADPAQPLAPGRHRFRLEVVDDAGNASEPAFLEVIVADTTRPTAVLDVVDASGRRLGPVVSAGQSFILSGARSTDLAPGRIVQYRFMLVDGR